MSDADLREVPSLPPTAFAVPENRWAENAAAEMTAAELLLYRSNLLGADLTVTNFGGGNTSAKLRDADPITGAHLKVLWVKGSGGDLGSMDLGGFATLELDRLRRLEALYGGLADEDRMVSYLPRCAFGPNPRAASIDTPLHAFLPFTHIDHVHPDSVIALAASTRGQEAAREIYGGTVGWLPWQRPGFDLGVRLRDYVAANPSLKGVILAGHGLICWGETSRSCYDNTIDLIAKTARYLNEKLDEPAFGGPARPALSAASRAKVAARLMPNLRGLMKGTSKVGHFSDDPETLEFVCSHDFARLAAIGTSCPDHFLRTKILPLVLDPERLDDRTYVAAAVDEYRAAYESYYHRSVGPDDPPMRDANPVIVLVPSLGRISFAADKTTARLAGEFYANAINVMRGATAIGDYVGLSEREAFRIEYWALEEAKLRRMQAPKPLAGRIALVTGAAGGIGRAVAIRLLGEDACVMLTDRDAGSLAEVRNELSALFSQDLVASTVCDVTVEQQIEDAFAAAARTFGGVDILVANAGIASSAPIEETSLDIWRRNHDVLAEGYFLASRAVFPLMKAQGGGSIIFIGSKNALAASPNAAAYASAKAAALHLARCLALEGAEHGIRVNVVNPDAVLRGSRIWDGAWRQERADAYGVDAGEGLEEYYRNRSLLKRDVLPEDVAEAVCFFATDASSKSTGNIINVDAGNAQAFTR